MQWQSREPQSWPREAGLAVLEGESGEARDAVVARWLAERRDSGGPTWLLQCRPQEGGTWAGLNTLVEDLVPALRERAPELLSRHARELCLVVPALRSELAFPESLTDTADDEEKTRNYAADRAYRSLHGLIDLLSEWNELTDPGQWSIACDGYDDANALVRRFFTELIRRCGPRLRLHMLAVAGPGRGEDVLAGVDPSAITAAVRLELPGRDAAVSSPEIWRLATELEEQLSDDPAAREAQLPRLIETWQRSDSPERAVRWQLAAMMRYNHAGLYEACLPYAVEVEPELERLYAENRDLYITAVTQLYFCYIPVGRADAILPILEQALPRIDNPGEVASCCYLLAMLHARFLTSTNQTLAEEYLQRGLGVLAQADLPEDKLQFLTVFTWNGLALVRLRQGRLQEALELCRAGIARLNEHLPPERHRLHRSVLLFNIAQVHAQIGPYEDAVAYFSEAMAMDPNYSEYYNDRGAVYLKMDRLQDAERDYLQAIELSPPYAEVWTNLGQCYRAMERMDDAVRAYSRALDLDPSCTLAVVGRADALLALDRAERALDDYGRALTMDPEQPLVLASRAILHYEAGRLPEALLDLNAAVTFAPDIGELYQNRAVALRELGRCDEAARDLRTYLQLCPDAEDRGDVEDSLALLTA
ncbi:MAG TPA: tetratricopeptide repeat protein [Solirubrobacteraceae bacterium]|jgi:tetratricopeptide (TPR) repeat protein|nr:tetratricopeptide repeat protein [Solirubrobacteraceae bacterium]